MIRRAALVMALAASGFALAQQAVSTPAGPWPTKPVRRQGVANSGAMKNAFDLACGMAGQRS